MADRTIYRLTEENDDGKPVKIVYSQFKEELEEERDNSEVETQYIEEIEFNAISTSSFSLFFLLNPETNESFGS